METLTALKMAHTAATAILLGCALGLGIWVWQTRRTGDATAGSRTLQRPRVFVWLLMGLALLSMPFTGWGMVHLVGWPLGQTWILASSVLYTVAALAWFIAGHANPVPQMFPILTLPVRDLVIGGVLILGLGIVAGLIPAVQAMRLQIAVALRRGA